MLPTLPLYHSCLGLPFSCDYKIGTSYPSFADCTAAIKMIPNGKTQLESVQGDQPALLIPDAFRDPKHLRIPAEFRSKTWSVFVTATKDPDRYSGPVAENLAQVV